MDQLLCTLSENRNRVPIRPPADDQGVASVVRRVGGARDRPDAMACCESGTAIQTTRRVLGLDEAPHRLDRRRASLHREGSTNRRRRVWYQKKVTCVEEERMTANEPVRQKRRDHVRAHGSIGRRIVGPNQCTAMPNCVTLNPVTMAGNKTHRWAATTPLFTRV
jgi:hypothetical protein